MFELTWVYFESELTLIDSINNCVLGAQYVLWLEIHYRHRTFLRKLSLNLFPNANLFIWDQVFPWKEKLKFIHSTLTQSGF